VILVGNQVRRGEARNNPPPEIKPTHEVQEWKVKKVRWANRQIGGNAPLATNSLVEAGL